jgi:hypothetical protein
VAGEPQRWRTGGALVYVDAPVIDQQAELTSASAFLRLGVGITGLVGVDLVSQRV